MRQFVKKENKTTLKALVWEVRKLKLLKITVLEVEVNFALQLERKHKSSKIPSRLNEEVEGITKSGLILKRGKLLKLRQSINYDK